MGNENFTIEQIKSSLDLFQRIKDMTFEDDVYIENINIEDNMIHVDYLNWGSCLGYRDTYFNSIEFPLNILIEKGFEGVRSYLLKL